MKFQLSQKFSKELKRFSKKYRSLPEDISKLQGILRALPEGSGQKHWNRLHVTGDGLVVIFKVRLSCASLKGQSLFRAIYAYNKRDEELVLIDFIELYYKGEKSNEDRGFIQEYIDSL
jgi:mRNA-degrading endonuclease YafQ of YafQ-DinJ toxin-antitoxin module